MAADETCRLKREEYKRTKHDPGFSKWEILIGPSDWKNFSLGKDGTERYRIHNLPISCSCPGLYELGIATSPTDVGRKTRELNASQIIVLYLGQADNVRTRLQQYGRAGSHLDHGNSIGLLNEDKSSCLARGPGLFREVFLRGFPIVFRWVLMRNKKEAEEAESRLLGIFDYAWNKGGNGDRRHDDVLLKLDKEALGTIDFNRHSKFGHWNWRTFGKKRVGLKILTSMPSNDTMPTSDSRRNLGFWISKFSENHPIVVPENGVGKGNYTMCGVFLGDGSVCKSRPIEGRKRCAEHKGKKIYGLISKSVISREEIIKGKGCSVLVIEDDIMCGVFLGDGSVCKNRPIEGRKRCAEHKGEKINGLISRSVISREEKGKGSFVLAIEDDIMCGVFLGDGSVCKNRPIEGRKRCAEHKGEKINGLTSRSVISREEIIKGKGSSVLVIEDDIMCGVFFGDGSVCKNRPIEGRKRCAEHKGKKINGLIAREEIMKGKGSSVLVIEDHLTCGASLGDGSVCRSRPIEGRKRCGRHKGKRINQP